MRTVIAGGHGQIALHLERLLAARGDTSVGLIRTAEQADDLRAAGAEPVVRDLESATVDEIAAVLAGADAAVFAAGAGPGSSSARKDTVDRAGAVLLADAAERAGVRRFVLISSIGADREPPAGTEPAFAAYLRAKRAAELDLAARTGLDWTILRPGALTDAPATGEVLLTEQTERGSVPRADVAATVAALLAAPGTAGRILGLVSGSTPVEEAVRGVS